MATPPGPGESAGDLSSSSTIVVIATIISNSGTSVITSLTSSTIVSPVSLTPSSSSSSSSPPVVTTTPLSSSIPISSSTTSSSSSSSPPPTSTSTIIKTPTGGGQQSTVIHTITTTNPITTPSTTGAAASTSASSYSPVGSAGSGSGSSSGPAASTVAPAVIVPVLFVAIAVILGIFLWRRRKQRKEAVEMRQKEMEEYSFNPNNDPTIPVVGAVSTNGGDDSHTEGGGYRGWGTTSSAATRKASTTLGAGSAAIGVARSDSGGRGYDNNYSPNAHSPEREARPTRSPEGLGALGAAPLTSTNKNQSVSRGISNASSAYSGAPRSDASDNGPGGFAGSPQYYDEFMSPDDAPHADGGYGPPVIRDVSARRNTRIENPAVFPQHGNAGISQNF